MALVFEGGGLGDWWGGSFAYRSPQQQRLLLGVQRWPLAEQVNPKFVVTERGMRPANRFMPKLRKPTPFETKTTSTCGPFIPCNQFFTPEAVASATSNSMSGLGVYGCGELDIVIERLEELLRRAKDMGGGEKNFVIAGAQGFLDKRTGISSFQVVLGSACTEDVREGNRHIAAVSALIGVAPPPELAPPDSVKPTDLLGTLKTVAIAAGIIAGAVILVPIVFEGVSIVRMIRKGATR